MNNKAINDSAFVRYEELSSKAVKYIQKFSDRIFSASCRTGNACYRKRMHLSVSDFPSLLYIQLRSLSSHLSPRRKPVVKLE